jgi:DNA-binding LytR/AlgR family response regulator
MDKLNKIQILTPTGSQIIDPDQIISVCPENRKSIIYLDDAQKILAYKGIEEMEKLLAFPFFFRCHWNCIINLHKVSSISSAFDSLQLKCGTQIPISKHRKSRMKQAIARFCRTNDEGRGGVKY